MGNNSRIVEEFVAAWNTDDTEAALGFLSDDICYHNMPFPELNGIDAVREFFAGVGTISNTDWRILNIAENGNVVLTERIDDFYLNGHPVSLPVMGTFVIERNKITVWRDYFDGVSFAQQTQPATQ